MPENKLREYLEENWGETILSIFEQKKESFLNRAWKDETIIKNFDNTLTKLYNIVEDFDILFNELYNIWVTDTEINIRQVDIKKIDNIISFHKTLCDQVKSIDEKTTELKNVVNNPNFSKILQWFNKLNYPGSWSSSIEKHETDINSVINNLKVDAIDISKTLNQKDDQIKELKGKVSKQEWKIANTSKKEVNKLIEGFIDLRDSFEKEEFKWLTYSFIVFLSLLFLLLIPVVDIFAYQYTYKIIFWGIMFVVWLLLLLPSLYIFASNDDLKNINEVPSDKKKPNEESQKNKKNQKKRNKVLEFIRRNIIRIWKKLDFVMFLWKSFKKGWFLILYVLILFLSLTTFLDWLSAPIKPVFWFEPRLSLIPIWVLFSSVLYFSVFQYGKAKKLRIENQNKVALLHWFIAIRTDNWDEISKSRFYDNVANVVFTKVFESKNSELNFPMDKALDIIRSLAEKNKN